MRRPDFVRARSDIHITGYNTLKAIVLSTLIITLCSPAFGQHKRITFQSLQEGLSHHQVKCILKDSKGFMWFGTYDGLNKYDGTNFVSYENDPGDSSSLCNSSINAIIEDKHHNIWIGTSNGLVVYDREKDNFSAVKDLANRSIIYVSSLYCDRNDVLWIGTSGSGLVLFDQRKRKIDSFWQDKRYAGALRSNFINCIISDNENNTWIGTREGLDRYNPENKTFTHFVHNEKDPNSLSGNFVNSLTVDKEGTLWVGTYGSGLNKSVKTGSTYTFKHFRQSDAPGGLSHNNILSLIADRKGNLWIGTENGGLNFLSYGSDKFSHFYHQDGNPKSLSSNSVWSLYEDDGGIIWIGTYNRGLSIIDEKYEKFECFERNDLAENTLVGNNVMGFSENAQGNLWIATDGGGLCTLNTKTRTFTTTINNASLSSKEVMAIMPDVHENLWVGTWAGGIDRLDKTGRKVRNYRNLGGSGFSNNNILCLYEDSERNIWAGSSGNGLFLYHAGVDNFFPVIDAAKKTRLNTNTTYVNDILQDSNNDIWVATLFGLTRIHKMDRDTYSFSEFLHSDDTGSISSFRVTVLFEDSRKNLWIGTEEGLNLFDRQEETFTVYLKKDGLPNNSIKGILEDNHRNLWISTNKGISKFNPADNKFENFSKDDGLVTNEFNVRSCIKTSSGELFFGGSDGINAFYPDSIKINTSVPPVYLTDFKVFNNSVKIGAADSPLKKNISETNKITLTYKQSSFTIEFVALNYTRSSKNQYAFILEGFEKEWNHVGTKHLATYTNLDPGTYLFKVKGSNNDGIWNETPTTLEITVLPPYWKTTTAYLLYFSVFSIVLFGFIKLLIIRSRQAQELRLEQMSHEKDEQLNKLKIQFFTNISHELRTPLSLILSPLEQIISTGEPKGELGKRLRNVLNNVERLFRLVNELMDFSKSEENQLKLTVQQGDIVKFVHEEFILFEDEARRRQIDYHFIADPETINAWFDSGKLEKIVLNLISNAFKFTPDQGKISVRVEQAGNLNNAARIDSVKISVIDNGSGISPAYIQKVFDRFFQSPEDKTKYQTGTGIGLALVKSLVELHHGNISVVSEKWKETRFTVVLPLGNSHLDENEIIVEQRDIPEQVSRTRQQTAPPDAPPQKPSIDSKVILFVEDNNDLRDYIVSILSVNYQVLEAADGEMGFEIASKYIPDLIISDIIMPKMDGIEFCRKIKTQVTTRNIPLILLTAKATEEDAEDGVKSGADMYITKPFDVNHLEASIKTLIETKRNLLA